MPGCLLLPPCLLWHTLLLARTGKQIHGKVEVTIRWVQRQPFGTARKHTRACLPALLPHYITTSWHQICWLNKPIYASC